MKTTEWVERSELVEVTKQVWCNCCGKDISTVDVEHDCIDGVHIEANFGYGSSRDGDRVEVDLCDECCAKIAATFVHKPKTTQCF
jgi:hypothetical protein